MNLRGMTRAYAQPDNARATVELAISLIIFASGVWLGATHWGNWPLTVLGFLGFMIGTMRMFGVQHDCGHYSFFTSRKANAIVGVLTGAITANPYYAMQYNHNRHHAYVGNLDKMEDHEVKTWTVRQYNDASLWGKLGYRAYRSVPSIFFFGPIFVILLRYRFPKNAMRVGLSDVVVQNGLMALLWYGYFLLGGWNALYFAGVSIVITACMGVIMVYVGHNHEETYWASGPQVDFEEASLRGANVIDMGPVFDFITFNFAYHDLHHLNARIPGYRLKQCHQDLTPHLNPVRLGFVDAIKCLRWKLWDEDKGRMVTFADARQETPALHPAE